MVDSMMTAYAGLYDSMMSTLPWADHSMICTLSTLYGSKICTVLNYGTVVSPGPEVWISTACAQFCAIKVYSFYHS